MRPLPWGDTERLVRLSESRGGREGRVPGTIMNGSYLAWAEAPETLEAIGYFSGDTQATLTGAGEATRVAMSRVTPSTIALLGVGPVRGRIFEAEEGRSQNGQPSVALISYPLWEQRFALRDDIAGQPIVIDGTQHTIVGVMPRQFRFPSAEARVWLSRHRGAGRALRRRAGIPADRPGICEPHPRGRRGQFIRRRAPDRVETRRLARALRFRRYRQALPGRAQGSRRPVRELPHHAQHHRLQHQSGEGRGGAEELRRPARAEMGRQDRQGASRLFRDDPDGDLPDVARSRLGVFREARQAARHAGAVGVRSAEEARARRTRRHGRRHRIRRAADQGVGQAGRAGIRHGGHAADHRAERDLQERPEPERRAAVPELLVLGRVPAAHRRRRRHALGASRRQGEGGPHAVQGHQADEGRRRRRSRSSPRRSRRATPSCSRCECGRASAALGEVLHHASHPTRLSRRSSALAAAAAFATPRRRRALRPRASRPR